VIAVPAPTVVDDSPEVPDKWITIHNAAPLLVATMLAYLAQITVSMRPATVRSTETDLRILAGFLIDHDPALSDAADIDRSDIEAFKLWQHAQPGTPGRRCGTARNARACHRRSVWGGPRWPTMSMTWGRDIRLYRQRDQCEMMIS